MRHPLLVLAAVALAGVAVPALAQAPAPAAATKPGPIKRGPDGKPDISGMFMADHGGANYGLEKRPATALTPGGRGLIIDPPDGMLPTQPWARAENEARKLPERGYDDPTAHCFVAGVPRSIYAPSPFHILQPPGYVVILHERMSWRQIPLDPSTSSGSPRAQSRGDGRAHLPDAIRLWQGDSNNDGVLTRQEFDAARLAQFRQLDADNNGQLTREEMRAERRAHGGRRGPGMGRGDHLARVDANNDGAITRDEGCITMRLPLLLVADVSLGLEGPQHRQHGGIGEWVFEMFADFGDGRRAAVPQDGHHVEFPVGERGHDRNLLKN